MYRYSTCSNEQGEVAPVAETGFSHRLTAYKIVGHFFGLSYLKISLNNHVENSFFRSSNISVPCPHAQLRGRTVIKKLWTFSDLRSRPLSVTAMLNFSGKANTSIHGLGEGATATNEAEKANYAIYNDFRSKIAFWFPWFIQTYFSALTL